MKKVILLLLFTVFAVSCSKKPMVEPAPRLVQNQNPVPTPTVNPNTGTGDDTTIVDSLEYQASIKKVIDAQNELTKAGHKLELSDEGKAKWKAHEIEVEVGLGQLKKMPWEPGYVIAYYRETLPTFNLKVKPVYKFIDEKSWPAIDKQLNDFIVAAQDHYASYQEDMPKKDKAELIEKFNLISQTQSDYESHMSVVIERKKIKVMSWGVLKSKFPNRNFIMCDNELDLIRVSDAAFDVDQSYLNQLKESGKIKFLEDPELSTFELESKFKVYENILIFIQAQ